MFFEYFRGVVRQLALANRLESRHLCGDIQTANARKEGKVRGFHLVTPSA